MSEANEIPQMKDPDNFGDKLKHFLAKTAKGAIKGAMWGVGLVALGFALSSVAMFIPGVGLGLKLLTAGAAAFGVGASATAVIGYTAAAGAALGAADGLTTTSQVVADNIDINGRMQAQYARQHRISDHLAQNAQLAIQNQQLAAGLGAMPRMQQAGMGMVAG